MRKSATMAPLKTNIIGKIRHNNSEKLLWLFRYHNNA